MSKLRELRAELAEAQERITQGTFLVEVLEAAGAPDVATVAIRRYQDEMLGLESLKAAFEAEQLRVTDTQKSMALAAFEETGATAMTFDTGSRASIRATYNYNTNPVFEFVREKYPELLRTEMNVLVDKKQLKREMSEEDWAHVEALRELKSVSVTIRHSEDADDGE